MFSFELYIKKGLSIIPVNGKIPLLKNWQKFCKEPTDFDDIENFKSHEYTGLGLCLGPASGLVAVDIDTDDKATLEAIPPSPIVRRGKKGEVRFFRYSDKIESRTYHDIDVEILSIGRQVVIPPSIHPETKQPYQWLTKDTLLNFDLSFLPELDLSFLNTLLSNKPIVKSTGGRNNKLKDIVTSMRCRGENEEKIVNEIYDYDKTHHNPRLFTDLNEPYRAKTEGEAKLFAHQFVTSITLSLLKNKDTKWISTHVELTDLEEEEIKKFEHKKMPMPQGVMGEIIKLTIGYSVRDIYELAFGGAISLFAGICSNRYQNNGVWSNEYVLNIGPTGCGKSFPEKIINHIYMNIPELNYLRGNGSYQSSSAIVSNFLSKRERFDLIDEIGSVFMKMKEGGVWQKDMMNPLLQLWSNSSIFYNGPSYSSTNDDSGKSKSDTSSCYNPCLTILGSTTEDTMSGLMDLSFFTSGLLPRFLFFKENGYGKLKDDYLELDKPLLSFICEEVRNILKVEKRKGDIKDVFGGPNYNPINLICNEKIRRLTRQISKDINNKVETEPSIVLKNMYTRGFEHIQKLSMLHCVSRKSTDLSEDDYAWATAVFDASVHNSSLFFREAEASNYYEKDLKKVLSYIEKNGKLTEGKLKNRFTSIKASNMKDIIQHLIDADKIVKTTNRKGGFNLQLKSNVQIDYLANT